MVISWDIYGYIYIYIWHCDISYMGVSEKRGYPIMVLLMGKWWWNMIFGGHLLRSQRIESFTIHAGAQLWIRYIHISDISYYVYIYIYDIYIICIYIYNMYIYIYNMYIYIWYVLYIYDLIWYDMIYDTIWYGMIWYDMYDMYVCM